MASDKQQRRLRRARKTRANAARRGIRRLSVHRTPRHVYAQVLSADGAHTLASASTLDKEVRGRIHGSGNRDAATVVGEVLAARARAAGIDRVAFDRSGYSYHGRVQALAEAARAGGLTF